MTHIPRSTRRLITGLAVVSAALFGTPHAHAAGISTAPTTVVQNVAHLDMGTPLVATTTPVVAGVLSSVAPASVPARAETKPDDGDGDNDNDKCGIDHDSDRDNDCKEIPPESEPDNDEDAEDEAEEGNACDNDAHDPAKCQTPPPAPEDVCETSGFSHATIADQLVDAGLPLNEPEANGPISSALVGSQLETTPLAPLVNEIACVLNLLTL